MKRLDIGAMAVEGLIGVGLTLIVEIIVDKIKTRKKKKSLDDSLVADLTVGELRKIFREEA